MPTRYERKQERDERNKKIYLMRKNGSSLNEIAEAYGFATQYIETLILRGKEVYHREEILRKWEEELAAQTREPTYQRKQLFVKAFGELVEQKAIDWYVKDKKVYYEEVVIYLREHFSCEIPGEEQEEFQEMFEQIKHELLDGWTETQKKSVQVYLKRKEGRMIRELAEEYGCSDSSIKTLIYDGEKRYRQWERYAKYKAIRPWE